MKAGPMNNSNTRPPQNSGYKYFDKQPVIKATEDGFTGDKENWFDGKYASEFL